MSALSPFLSITLISVGLSLLIAIIYRLLTNPGAIRKSKEDMKFFKEKMAQANKAGDKAKSGEYAGEMLKASQAQFRMNMRPMIASMAVFVLILGWLNTSFGGVVVDFTKPGASFAYGGGGPFNVSYNKTDAGIVVGVDLDGDGTFSAGETYRQGEVFGYMGAYWRVTPVTEGFFLAPSEKPDAVHFEMLVAALPFSIPFLGSYLSWFWWYVFLSAPATIVFRKALGAE